MLINLSDHPAAKWSRTQREAAEQQFGSVEDMPFPVIDPTASLEDVARVAREYADTCEQRLNTAADGGTESRPTSGAHAVHLMGEFTFTYLFVKEMEERDILCIASTTERIVTDNPDGSKTTVFQFVQFRPYFHTRQAIRKLTSRFRRLLDEE